MAWDMSCMLVLPFVQAVPANLTRYGLSQIINHLLALGELADAAHAGPFPSRLASQL